MIDLHTKVPDQVPGLSDYSAAEIDLASKSRSWPAITRYLSLIHKPPVTSADTLRIERHQSWLRCALATYFNRAHASTICRFWSQQADELILKAWQLACENTKLAGTSSSALLALGKLGSDELNLSSDVDLIFVRRDDQPAEIKAVKEFQSLLSDATEFGFCLRVDLTLRPGGRGAALIPSASEFEYHYGYHGEMWERLAYVRMRPLTGDADLLRGIVDFTTKFSFRKRLDYTLLDELKSLRTKIRSEKFEKRANAFHLKLGEGGIRELELFVHALLVMHGGRNPALRTRSTTGGIARLKELKILPAVECDFLIEAYWYLRDLENRLHAYEDQQTYLIDLASGHPALPENFSSRLQDTCLRISTIVTSLFGEPPSGASLPQALLDQQEWLASEGFSEHSCQTTWPDLLSATALSLKTERDERARLDFLLGFVSSLAKIGLDRDLGLAHLLDFVRAIRAKASFFTLLNRETRVRDNLAMLFSVSPYMGSLMSSRPELVDEFIYRKQAEPSGDLGSLLEELAERRLLVELIAANEFLSKRDLGLLTTNITSNADSICIALLEALNKEYGHSKLALLAMGKWGGRELGLRSDLDFIFVIDGVPSSNDQKIARRFLSRITEPHRGGSIYSVDMRLRPSGNAGPILVSLDELKSFITTQAAAWERQAYLRARLVSLDSGSRLGFHPAQLSAHQGLSAVDRSELREIRAKLFGDDVREKSWDELDLKLSYGGLADVEFTAQIALLDKREFSLDPSTSGMIQYLEGIDQAWNAVGKNLRTQYESLRQIEQLYQLTTSQSGSTIKVKSDEFRRVALLLNVSSVDLEARVRSSLKTVGDALQELRV